jgi:pyrimidine-specific ribonucleoside hydrolase
MKNIIIDCDPGHDDAIALMLAIANQDVLNLAGVTTVCGNQSLKLVTENALKLLSYLKADYKVAKGADKPLVRDIRFSAAAHGKSGMDGPELPEPSMSPVDMDAVPFMADLIRSSSEKVTIVALAPLTNVALLLKAYPGIKHKIAQISLMGGGIEKGNITSVAEFNIYTDPEAAKIVFESGIPIVMSGIEVCEKACIYPEEIDRMLSGGKASHLAGRLLQFYSIYSKAAHYEGSPLYDPCAVAWLLEPELFTSRRFHIDVETQGLATRGMTVADKRPNPQGGFNAEVLQTVDRDGFIRLIFDSLARLDRHFQD